MAKSKTLAADTNTTVGVLRRTKNASVAAPITISEYQLNGENFFFKFEKGDNLKKYGEQVFPVVISASEPEVTFDLLNNPIHAMQWEHLRRLAENKMYVFSESYPLCELAEPEKEAKDLLGFYELKEKAGELFRTLQTPEERSDFATLFNLHYGEDTNIKIALLQLIDTKPNVFIEAWSNHNKEVTVMVHKAINMNIINRRPDGIYQYGATLLGDSIDSVIAELIQMQDLLPVLRNQIKATKH